ncbi:MAG: hypothetical protein C0399_08290 [Syntrophus sp. (in: bacteria)]|nr:hypothetical protein [Syntrophus sp. (in: bacteria)]
MLRYIITPILLALLFINMSVCDAYSGFTADQKETVVFTQLKDQDLPSQIAPQDPGQYTQSGPEQYQQGQPSYPSPAGQGTTGGSQGRTNAPGGQQMIQQGGQGGCKIQLSEDRTNIALIDQSGQETEHVSLGQDRVQKIFKAPDNSWNVVVFKVRQRQEFGAIAINMVECDAQEARDIWAVPVQIEFFRKALPTLLRSMFLCHMNFH